MLVLDVVLSLARTCYNRTHTTRIPGSHQSRSLFFSGFLPPVVSGQSSVVGTRRFIVDIVHRELPRVDILAVSGRVQAPEAAQLQERINALFAERRSRIVLDFERLEYISSGGLRVLVLARKTAQDAQGDVRIVNLPERLRKVFDLVGLTTIFTFYDDMVDAVGSF